MAVEMGVYLFDGYADWELGYLLGFSRPRGVTVTAVGQKDKVTSMGGLEVNVKHPLSWLDEARCSCVVLPGATSWSQPELHRAVSDRIARLCDRGIYVAAICGATLSLARLGLLNGARHTSNSLAFIKAAVPEYRGDELYSDELCVVDRNAHIVTAPGSASLEFAVAIMRLLEIAPDGEISEGYRLLKNGR